MLTHAPTCEVNRGGDHGPCDCGYDEQVRARRHKVYTVEELLDLVRGYRYALQLEDVTSSLLAVRDAIEATVRQRDALREAAEETIDNCDHSKDCPCCRSLRRALEVR